jgi:hypothetical protein
MSPAPLSPEALGHAVGQQTLDVNRQGRDVRKGSMPMQSFFTSDFFLEIRAMLSETRKA